MFWVVALQLACSSPEQGIGVGQRAPEFPSAPEVSGSALEGQQSVLFFWSARSGASRQQADALREWADGGELRVLAYGLAGSSEADRDFAESRLPVGAWRPHGAVEARAAWQVDEVPTLLVLDDEAIVRHRGSQLPTTDVLSVED